MSHFAVTVVTSNQPEEEEIGRILQPWHEFECTGIDDQYVQNVDVTEEARATYEAETSRRLRGPKGGLYSPYEDRFYRDPSEDEQRELGPIAGTGYRGDVSFTSRDWGDGKGYRTKIRFVPDGYTEVVLPIREVSAFADWASDYYALKKTKDPAKRAGKYGYVHVDRDGQVISVTDRTNPNKRWDWWIIGGRWSGHLRLKSGVRPIVGRPGAFGNKAEVGHGDQAAIHDIDIAGLREEASARAGLLWGSVHAITAGLPPARSWDDLRAERPGDVDKAREIYWAQPVVAAVKSAFPNQWDINDELDAARIERDAFCQRQADRKLPTHALVHEGQWFERGEMGWFAAVHNEKDADDWSVEFNKLIDSLPDTHWLTIVDCHI